MHTKNRQRKSKCWSSGYHSRPAFSHARRIFNNYIISNYYPTVNHPSYLSTTLSPLSSHHFSPPILFFTPIPPHNPHKHLIHRRLPHGIILQPQTFLTPFQQPKQRPDPSSPSSSFYSSTPLIPTSSSGSMHRKPNLPAIRLLLHLHHLTPRPPKFPPHPLLHRLNLPLARIRRALQHQMHIQRPAPPPLPQLLHAPHRQHPAAHDARPVPKGVGLLHRMRRQQHRAPGLDGAKHGPELTLGARI